MKKKYIIIAVIGIVVFLTILSTAKKKADNSATASTKITTNLETTSTVSNSITGTWVVDHFLINGSKFSVEEEEIASGKDYSNWKFVIKNGGSVFVYDGENGEIDKWEETETGVTITTADGLIYGTIKDGLLYLQIDEEAKKENGNIICLVKLSDAQEANFSKSSTTADQGGISIGKKNALKQAKSYLKYQSFSKQGLVEQLKHEGYTDEEAAYGVDNCGADWYEQAASKAKSYLKYQSFSRQGLIEQLEYEGFTPDQAEYGVTANGY